MLLLFLYSFHIQMKTTVKTLKDSGLFTSYFGMKLKCQLDHKEISESIFIVSDRAGPHCGLKTCQMLSLHLHLNQRAPALKSNHMDI